MKVIHLLRKPLSESTVASNTLKHGVGGLNIGESRLSTGDNLNGGAYAENPTHRAGQDMWTRDRKGDTNCFKRGGAGDFTPPTGRWPANVILQHLNGCEWDGVKRVKGSPKPYVRDTEVKNRVYGKGAGLQEKGYQTTNYGDADGKETVANWICAEGCPVKALDEQSGNLLPQGSQKKLDTAANSFLGTGYGGSEKSTYYGDTGGASRFFKQVGGPSGSHEEIEVPDCLVESVPMKEWQKGYTKDQLKEWEGSSHPSMKSAFPPLWL